MAKSKWILKLIDAMLTILLSEAQVIFKVGTNQDGWFSADNLLDQVENAINIFEAKTNNFTTGLLMFDNAPSHQKWLPDALSARKMPINSGQVQKEDPGCGMGGTWVDQIRSHNIFISLMITLNFLVGLRALRTSFANMVFGQMKD